MRLRGALIAAVGVAGLSAAFLFSRGSTGQPGEPIEAPVSGAATGEATASLLAPPDAPDASAGELDVVPPPEPTKLTEEVPAADWRSTLERDLLEKYQSLTVEELDVARHEMHERLGSMLLEVGDELIEKGIYTPLPGGRKPPKEALKPTQTSTFNPVLKWDGTEFKRVDVEVWDRPELEIVKAEQDWLDEYFFERVLAEQPGWVAGGD